MDYKEILMSGKNLNPTRIRTVGFHFYNILEVDKAIQLWSMSQKIGDRIDLCKVSHKI